MRCGHGGKLTHWFTSDRSDWEIKWCERCGSLRKFNIITKKFQWLYPAWTKERINSKKSVKVSRK